jgi:D-methionine transport system substrate-binding protein
MKKNIFSALLLALALFVTEALAGAPALAQVRTVIKVGATAGPQAQILEAAKVVLAREGIDMQIIEFSDYAVPNAALDQGDLDANSFQHKPFLDAQIKARGFDLTPIGTTVILPMGLYSKKINNLAELKDGATVAIPNDPSNGGRGLLLMQKFGLLRLRPEAGILPSPFDVTANPKNLKIVEVEAAQAPRVLDDVDLVAVNTNYALNVGLVPTRDSIALEDKDSPYACVIVVRTKDKDRPEMQKLVKAYQSPEVAQFIEDTFKGSIVKAW